MKKKYLKILILSIILSILLWQGNIFRFFNNRSTAFAVGDLVIDWGVSSGQPIFQVNNFLPGEAVERRVKILNSGPLVKPVGVVGVKTQEMGSLSEVLEINIFQNGTEIYGGKNLSQFFQETAIPNAIFLFNLNPGEEKEVKFKVKFKEGAGNDYQGAKVVFDILLGVYYHLPEECLGIKFNGSPIFGTAKNDNLKGTNGNDLIFGFEGNDKINGSNGDDCIVGGAGDDQLDGSNGDDVIFGNGGNDKIDGSNGNDLIFAGVGNDVIDGSNGNDKIYGGEGEDRLYGKNGNDFLRGDEGKDIADGGLNTDECEAETKIKCEQ